MNLVGRDDLIQGTKRGKSGSEEGKDVVGRSREEVLRKGLSRSEP